jgi:hypothetical protein
MSLSRKSLQTSHIDFDLSCQSRGYHVMVAQGDRLFVAAGNTNAGDRRDVMTTELYDIECDKWTTLSPSLHGQSEAPAVKCDGRIYILGGYSWDAHSFQVTDLVLQFSGSSIWVILLLKESTFCMNYL